MSAESAWSENQREIRELKREIESFKEDRNRFTVILREKDAEIERLKESAKYDAFLREKYRGLITELCDALEGELPPKGSIYTAERAGALIAKRSLLQRAREATR